MVSVHKISIGQIVTSTAGRDLGRRYLVIGITGKYALLVNGRDRLMACPKKKNTRHIKVDQTIATTVMEEIFSKGAAANEPIRQLIASLYTG